MATHKDIDGGQHHQQDARHDAGSKHLANGNAGDQGVEDHQDAGRNQYAPAAAGIDHAQGHVFVIAPFQHRRQGDGAHGHHRSTADADHGSKHRTDAKSAQSQSASQAAAPEVHHPVKIPGDTGTLQNHGHEDEQRDGNQGEAFHGAPDLGGHHVERVEAPGEIQEHHRYATENKRQRQAQQQEKQQRTEKQESQGFNAHS